MNPQWRPAGRGHSFFSFIKEFCADDIGANNRAVHRLCSLMRKMDVETVIIEDLDFSHPEIQDEISALQTFYESKANIEVRRFTFIAEKITALEQIPSLLSEQFLATAIIIKFREHNKKWGSYLFRSIITLPRYRNRKENGKQKGAGYSLLLNNYTHIYKTFRCEVGINDTEFHPFNITGTVFCQQNSVTSVCAHAALCMAINNQSLHNTPLVSPEDINKILGVDHKIAKLNLTRAIRRDDLDKVFKAYNLAFTPLKEFYSHQGTAKYSDYVYKYIESKCPVLLVFTTDDEKTDHVIPIFGHTLNSDMWTPEAEFAYSAPKSKLTRYKSTSSWADHFVIHDDNFGAYYCLPREAIKGPNRGKNHRPFRARFAFAIVPTKVITPPREAEWAAIFILDALFEDLKAGQTILDDWSKIVAYSQPVVTRTLLTTRDEYARSLDKKDFDNVSFSPKDKENLTKHLPPRFWLSEITIPDIYTANHSKIIDFFYKCDQKPTKKVADMLQKIIQVRFPGALKVQLQAFAEELSVKSHYPLFEFDRTFHIPKW